MINNFFNISDLDKDQILKIIEMDINFKFTENKSIGLLFEKYSTRTRLSFSVGISSLGGNAIDIRLEDLNFIRHESFEDTFRAMNCYLDGLVYRTDNHQKLIEASNYFKKPIINALSNKSHPCQILSDLLTLNEHFGSLKCNILWIGDMNNVCFSLIEAANIIDELSLTICSPNEISNKLNWQMNSNISLFNDLQDIDLKSINCVMTDVYLSMNDKDSEEKIKILKPYSVDSKLMSKTDINSVFMHCLPAQVGLEVSEEVFKSPNSIVWKQAYNRMIAQNKLLQFIYQ